MGEQLLETEQIGEGYPPLDNGPDAVPAARQALGCSAGGRYFASTCSKGCEPRPLQPMGRTSPP